ncbi:MAG TPA: glycosyltransferase [Chryseosolibacter sp.]|nr:glycosyltransferase [Chryseosolibacter sp.]
MLILLIVFLLAALIQLIYFTVFLVALTQKTPVNARGSQPVSVVVCAHDEEENLKELVPELLKQDYGTFEVIVVNDRSNDNTYDYLLEATRHDSRLKMVNVKDTPDHVNSKKYALTLGIRAASYEWVLLTDADCRPRSTKWISAMSARFDDQSKFIIGFSPYQEKPGFLNLFQRFDSLVTAIQYIGFALLRNPYMGVGRNLAYRKSLFLEKKGFNNFLHVTGGDDDLFVNQHANGKNARVEYNVDSLVYSVPKTTWSSFFNQKIRHMSVGKYYKGKHRFLLGVFMLSWMLTLFVGYPLIGLTPAYNIVFGYAVVGVILLRWILMISCLHNFLKKPELAFSYWVIPILDLLYPIYYISTGLVTLFTRKVRWTK